MAWDFKEINKDLFKWVNVLLVDLTSFCIVVVIYLCTLSYYTITIFLVVTCPDPTPVNGTATVFSKIQDPPGDGTFYEYTLLFFECNSGYTLRLPYSFCNGDGQ